MKRVYRIVVAVAVAGLAPLLLTGCRAGASVGAGKWDLGLKVDPFRAVDVNLDRRITQEEFAAYLFRASFIQLDANADGVVQVSEWRATEDGADSEKMFASMDKDNDGALTFEEFSSPKEKQETVANLFATLDGNDDDVLTSSELAK